MAIADLDDTRTLAPEPRTLSPWAWLGIGAAAGILGLLAWIITGMRLPLQNLWATNTMPDDMPIALLPLSQYTTSTVTAYLVTGSVAAGIVARATRARQGRRGFLTLVVGVLLVQLIAIVQSVAVVGNGLRSGFESLIYLAAVIVVVTVSFAIGVLTLFLIARAPRAGALLGLGVAALAVTWWAEALVAAPFALTTPWQSTLLNEMRWLPAILCGIAIAWAGIGSVGRVIAAVIAIVVVTIVPVVVTAIVNATGSRVLARYPSEMLDYGVQVFQAAIHQVDVTVIPPILIIVVAAVGLGLKVVLRRRSTSLREVTAVDAEDRSSHPAGRGEERDS